MAQSSERPIERDMTTAQLVNDRVAYLEAGVPMHTAWIRDLTPVREQTINEYAAVRRELSRRAGVTTMKRNRELIRKIRGEGWR